MYTTGKTKGNRGMGGKGISEEPYECGADHVEHVNERDDGGEGNQFKACIGGESSTYEEHRSMHEDMRKGCNVLHRCQQDDYERNEEGWEKDGVGLC